MNVIGRSYEIEGRTVLITGGARGIGADAARRLLDAGANVALVDADALALEQTNARLGDRAVAFTADVTDALALDAAVAATLRRFGRIDVAIANAGVSGRPATVATIDPIEFERVIEINLLGVWRTIRATLPHVVERRGYLLPIASVAALIPSPLIAAYAASKHGVEGFARSLRLELAHTGTKVGVGYFSFIDTDMVRNALVEPAAARGIGSLPGFLSRPLPVGAAGAAIVRGVERRANRVYAPRWVPALIAVRGIGGPVESLAGRDPRLVKALREAESAKAAEVGASAIAAGPGTDELIEVTS
jgi:NAD(P)-dependent dehydrogenase (short-subunit alcohol dehydrogenase family)